MQGPFAAPERPSYWLAALKSSQGLRLANTACKVIYNYISAIAWLAQNLWRCRWNGGSQDEAIEFFGRRLASRWGQPSSAASLHNMTCARDRMKQSRGRVSKK